MFVSSKAPKALARWYREVLGLDVGLWGGAALAFDLAGHPREVARTARADCSDGMSPSTREFRVDFAVDERAAIVARLTESGVAVLKRDDDRAFGRFARCRTRL